MALTKKDFEAAAFADVDRYPALAVAFRAGDPRVTQHIGAIAAMCAALSQETEVAAMERFSKERDSTILADAALRGIVPRAQGARVQVTVKNNGAALVSLPVGRMLLDTKGNPYEVESPVNVGPGETAQVVLRQGVTQVIRHTVTESMPFYAIEVPKPDDGSYLASISVSGAGKSFEWSRHYTNIEVDARVFHVEVDDRKRVYVRFGMEGIVGHQPYAGDVIELVVTYAFGDLLPDAGSQFALDYTSAHEGGIDLVLDSVIQRGQDPVSIDVLRELAKYPSTYAEDAVFLGEFDYLVRKEFLNLRFSSVWNEAAEELARGPNIRNINRLFVAVLGQDGHEAHVSDPKDFRVLDAGELTGLQQAIQRKILQADDSYTVSFCTPVRQEIPVRIRGRASSSYSSSDVAQQVRNLVLNAFGEHTAGARRGYNQPLYREVYDLLRANVPALIGDGADWQIEIEAQNTKAHPEVWRYVSESSLSVAIEIVNTVRPSWGS